MITANYIFSELITAHTKIESFRTGLLPAAGRSYTLYLLGKGARTAVASLAHVVSVIVLTIFCLIAAPFKCLYTCVQKPTPPMPLIVPQAHTPVMPITPAATPPTVSAELPIVPLVAAERSTVFLVDRLEANTWIDVQKRLESYIASVRAKDPAIFTQEYPISVSFSNRCYINVNQNSGCIEIPAAWLLQKSVIPTEFHIIDHSDSKLGATGFIHHYALWLRSIGIDIEECSEDDVRLGLLMTTLPPEEHNATIQFLLCHETGHSTKSQVTKLLALATADTGSDLIGGYLPPDTIRTERHNLELEADRFAIHTLKDIGLLGLRSFAKCYAAEEDFATALEDSGFAEALCCVDERCAHYGCQSHPSYLQRITAAEKLLA